MFASVEAKSSIREEIQEASKRRSFFQRQEGLFRRGHEFGEIFKEFDGSICITIQLGSKWYIYNSQKNENDSKCSWPPSTEAIVSFCALTKCLYLADFVAKPTYVRAVV